MNWKPSARTAALLLAVAAVALSLLAATNDRLPGDLWLVRQAQDLPGWFEDVAKGVRNVTSTQTVLVLGFLLGLVVLWRGERALGAVCLAAIIALPVVQAGIKNVVDRPRPSTALVDRRDTFTSESFPSGHTMSGAVLLILIAMTVWSLAPGRALRWSAVGAGAAVLLLSMVGDLYLGVHWPSDVLGGLLWAAALIAVIAVVASLAERKLAEAN